MEPEEFDNVSRTLAAPSTRRVALAALVGGALLLPGYGEGEATKKAKRRKARKRHARHAGNQLKPSWVWLENPGTTTVTVQHGEKTRTSCCNRVNTFDLGPGERKPVAATWNSGGKPTRAYVWLNAHYWVGFDNLPSQLPDVAASFGGQPENRPFPMVAFCCFTKGTTVLKPKGLNVNEYVDITMESQVFRVRRNPDLKHYKQFTVTLPTTLPPVT